MIVVIAKYKTGNVHSVVNCFQRLGVEPTLRDDAELKFIAGRVLFPGRGEANIQKKIFIECLNCFRLEWIILCEDVYVGKNNVWNEDTKKDEALFLKYYARTDMKNVLCIDISIDELLAESVFWLYLYMSIILFFPKIGLIVDGCIFCIDDIRNLYKDRQYSDIFFKEINEGNMDLGSSKSVSYKTVKPGATRCYNNTDYCRADKDVANPLDSPAELLYFIEGRNKEMPEGSCTTSLFSEGWSSMAKKVGEESFESVIKDADGTGECFMYKLAYNIYHVIAYKSIC